MQNDKALGRRDGIGTVSNHYHTVLYVDSSRALNWEDKEVVERWKQLFSGVVLVDRYMDRECAC